MRSWPIFRAAAGSPPDGVDPDPVVCVVVDEQTSADELQHTFGSTPPANRPIEHYRTMRCETLDSDPLSAADALAAALVGQLRRVVYGQGSVVVEFRSSGRPAPGPRRSSRRSRPRCGGRCA
jgi:hypothetical protein